ncbi:GNAT family N-acetyltransferase [Streptomyces sp. NPDC101191]|uniref:GNAT family N-acetyltransferase n=1 Tax=Streptomyces sp. NPDC101191 TaxID=3366126 RepID=UPI0037F82EB4
MDFVDVALDSVWPAELRTDRLLLRPVTTEDASLVRELMTDERVRTYLGGPASLERVAARQAAYPATAGAWTVVRIADGRAVGLAGIGPDPRCKGRAEVSYQLLPSAWGSGLGREAVSAIVSWWTAAVPRGGPLVAVTQAANTRSRRLLESVGMVLVDQFDEHGARQCLYTPDGDEDDADLRWFRLVASRLDEVERRRGAQARATAAGQRLPEDLAALTPGELARLCPAHHGAYGRICAHAAGHTPALHLGRAPDGAWIAWLAGARGITPPPEPAGRAPGGRRG